MPSTIDRVFAPITRLAAPRIPLDEEAQAVPLELIHGQYPTDAPPPYEEHAQNTPSGSAAGVQNNNRVLAPPAIQDSLATYRPMCIPSGRSEA